MYAIAIDVGVKNLGICVYDFYTNKVIHWENTALVDGRYVPANNVSYVRTFIENNAAYFAAAHVVLVEKQIRCNMRIIEAIIQTLYYDRCIIINARSVKAHYHIGHRDYRLNKAAAVEWAQAFVQNNPSAFAGGVADCMQSKKKDDVADALLLLMFYLDTYSLKISKPTE